MPTFAIYAFSAVNLMKRLFTRRRIIALLALPSLYLLATAWLVCDGLVDRLGHADVALVLGSKVEMNGKPSVRLQGRLDRTVELYKAGYFPWVIASGGVGKEGFDEAAVMRDYLVGQGVPADHVILDSHGDNTFASAQNTLAIAKQKHFTSVMAISQYFHLPRSRLALQRCGFKPVYTAHAKLFEWRDVYSSLRETLGYVKYSVRSF
ncbi:MAG: putative rane protein [Verrucomicrobiaceae bacterium]|nr:putative rane protein [Verrucomicrobiaceae bacterium]